MNGGYIKISDDRVTVEPEGGTVWMTKHQIAQLFECFVPKVSSNISSILKSGVLDESKVYRLHCQSDGNYIELYDLEMIVALAFRIRSRNADLFRRWLIGRTASRTNSRRFSVLVASGRKALVS